MWHEIKNADSNARGSVPMQRPGLELTNEFMELLFGHENMSTVVNQCASVLHV